MLNYDYKCKKVIKGIFKYVKANNAPIYGQSCGSKRKRSYYNF